MAEAKKTNGAAPEVKPIKRGHDTWRLREHANNEFRAFVGADVELTDLVNPQLWTVVASELQAYDRITVIREDRAYLAEVLVLDARPGFAQVLVVHSISPLPPLAKEDAGMPLGFRIFHDPRRGKYFAERISDRVTMNGDGSNTHQEARRALLDHASLRK